MALFHGKSRKHARCGRLLALGCSRLMAGWQQDIKKSLYLYLLL
jgi:hypothetical protein